MKVSATTLSGRWLRIATNLILFVCVSAICLLICEFVLRMVYRERISFFPRNHTDAQYGEYKLRRLRPNITYWQTSVDGSWKFETNAQGFRSNHDFAYEKAPNQTRVICLGDSHTQGWEVRQDFTYSAVIERYLNLNGVDAEVLNTGISGFSTAEELAFLEKEGVKYAPDAVVLGFYANDLEDNVKADLFRVADSKLEVNKTEHVPGVAIQKLTYHIPFTKWLGENSYLYTLAYNSAWDYAKKLLYSRQKEAISDEFAIPSGSVTDYQVQLETSLLQRLFEFCTKNNIKLIILDIPQVRVYQDAPFGGFVPSFPEELVSVARANSDAFIQSKDLLADYDGVAQLHVEHGLMHISEFTHELLGVAAAKQIRAFVRPSEVSDNS